MTSIKYISARICSIKGVKSLFRLFLPFLFSDHESVRFREKFLAGLMMISGQYKYAIKILTKDKQLATDIGSDVVIIDPGFVSLQGHHHNVNIYYRRLLNDLGIHSKVLRSVIEDDSLIDDQTDSVSTFVLSPYEMGFNPYLSYEKQITYLNNLFHNEFNRALLESDLKLIIVHTVRHTFIEGFSRFLESYCSRQKKCSLVMGIIEKDIFLADHPSHSVLREVYQRSFNLLTSISNLEIFFNVETSEMAEFVKQMSRGKINARVQPHITSSLKEVKRVHTSKTNTIPRLGFIGQTRLEKGINILPHIIKKSILESENPLKWFVQLDMNILGNHFNGDFKEMKTWLENSDSVNIFPAKLPLQTYYDLMRQIDILVMPYSNRYEFTGSGISNESLRFGHIQILPKKSSMFRNSEAIGAGNVAFEETAVESVTNAILYAIDNYESLRLKSLAATEINENGFEHSKELNDLINKALQTN